MVYISMMQEPPLPPGVIPETAEVSESEKLTGKKHQLPGTWLCLSSVIAVAQLSLNQRSCLMRNGIAA